MNGNFGENDLTAARPRLLAECFGKVYWWMAFALAVSGLVAYTIAASATLQRVFLNMPVFLTLCIIELLMVMAVSGAINRLSASTAAALFILYATLNGMTLSVIFMIYTSGSIAQTFFITAGTFGATAAVGTITRRDLGSMGGVLLMLMIGLLVAMVVNISWSNSLLYWISTFAGVLIFSALTAYDANKIKMWCGELEDDDPEAVGRIAVLGALSLYLDFVNLLLFLLRIFGRRR